MNDDRRPALLMHPVVHVHRCPHCHDPRDADKKYCDRCQTWADRYAEVFGKTLRLKRNP